MLITGCEAWRPISPLSTAASMRVEVEVYKGPLVQPVTSQYAELDGALAEAGKAFRDWEVLAKVAHATPDLCPNPFVEKLREIKDPTIDPAGNEMESMAEPPEEASKGSPAKTQPRDVAETRKGKAIEARNNRKRAVLHRPEKCRKLEEAMLQARDLKEQITKLLGSKLDWNAASTPSLGDQMKYLAKAVEIAARMRGKAVYTAYDQLPSLQSKDVRPLLWGWTTLATTYSNELNARATALLKQIGDTDQSTPVKGHHLSVGDHLKNANPSEFFHLLDWYNTVNDRQVRIDGLSEADRVRMGQRLFSDQYWGKVNEVQANGQGNVRMAFVRDAIGNWNLRSFDNDPKELLDAYRKITKAGVKLATGLASTVAGNSSATELLGVANQMINNELGSGDQGITSSKEVDALHKRLIKDVEQAQKDLKMAKVVPADVQSQQKGVSDEVGRLEEKVKELEGKLAAPAPDGDPDGAVGPTKEELEVQLEEARAELGSAKAKLKGTNQTIDETVNAQVQRVLDGVKADLQAHIDIIDGLKAAEVAGEISKPGSQ